MAKVRVGAWNIGKAGISKSRGARVAQFILDWFGIKATPTKKYESSFSKYSFSDYYTTKVKQPSNLLFGKFIHTSTLVPNPTLGGVHHPFPSKEYHDQKPKSKLAPHGFTLQNTGIDVLFLSEVSTDVAEALKLIHEYCGSQLDIHHKVKHKQVGMAVIARHKRFTFQTIKSGYRNIEVAHLTNTPLVCFGCHAKSGGGHKTQEDIADILGNISISMKVHNDNYFGMAIGDFNTVLPDPTKQPYGERRHYVTLGQNAGREWRAVHAGFATHGSNALDFAWVSWGKKTRVFKWSKTPPLDVSKILYSKFKLNMSDHYPIAYQVEF